MTANRNQYATGIRRSLEFTDKARGKQILSLFDFLKEEYARFDNARVLGQGAHDHESRSRFPNESARADTRLIAGGGAHGRRAAPETDGHQSRPDDDVLDCGTG